VRTFVIACHEMPERLEAVTAHLASVHTPFTVWPGVHGKTWAVDTTAEYEPGQRISPGHVGLLLGHWTLWNHLAASAEDADSDSTDEYERMWLILEDDVVLPHDWHVRSRALLVELDERFPDWQFVFVGLAETEPHVWNKVTERIGGPDSRLCRMTDPFGTHAYLVRESALPVLRRLFPAGGARRNMDQQLFRNVLQDNHLRWCAVLPTLITQRTFDYTGVGKPEWGPSTVDHGTPPAARANPAAHEPPDLAARTMAYVDPFPCYYRGEALEGNARSPERRKSVPAFECALLRKPCHVKPVDAVGDVSLTRWDGTATHVVPVRACETCSKRTSTAAATGKRDRLPLPDGHFNPSVLRWPAPGRPNRVVLATRDSWGHSKVALWDLKNSAADGWSGAWSVLPIGSFASPHPEATRLEDPRLFAAVGPAGTRLHCMFSLPDAYPPKIVQVGYVRFDRDLRGIEHTEVFRSPRGNAYEKNWVPFYRDSGIHWVYAGKPQHHVMFPGGSYITPNPLPWAGGFWRGGAAPHRRGDEYYHFFHGCMKRYTGSVYSVGCAVFEAKPPFRILRQTASPLLWPDAPATGENVVKSQVIWPGGVIRVEGGWVLACGVDDTHCKMHHFTDEEVEAAMTDQPEPESEGGFRDTPAAHGTAGHPAWSDNDFRGLGDTDAPGDSGGDCVH